IHEFVLESTGHDTDVIFGVCDDENLGDKISVTVIATGFEEKGISTETPYDRKVVLSLDEKRKQPLKQDKKEDTASLFDNTLTFDMEKSGSSQETQAKSDASPSQENPKPVEETRDESFTISRKNEENFTFRNDSSSQQLDRTKRLMELNRGIRSPSSFSELENEPAYKRKNIQLSNMPHSSESAMSRYSLSSEQDEGTLIKKNNSFLHDNVD
ncbi:MAG TPA: hypothetical protein VNJ07_04435, partial [Chitinophagales bacterium]|nr:hypothetical protein [Chitinophagales bacterium]